MTKATTPQRLVLVVQLQPPKTVQALSVRTVFLVRLPLQVAVAAVVALAVLAQELLAQ